QTPVPLRRPPPLPAPAPRRVRHHDAPRRGRLRHRGGGPVAGDRTAGRPPRLRPRPTGAEPRRHRLRAVGPDRRDGRDRRGTGPVPGGADGPAARRTGEPGPEGREPGGLLGSLRPGWGPGGRAVLRCRADGAGAGPVVAAGGHGYRTPVPAATGTGPPCLRPRGPDPRACGQTGPARSGDRRVLGPACAGPVVCWVGRVLGTAYCGPADTDRLLRTRVLRSGGCRRGVAPSAAPGARPGTKRVRIPDAPHAIGTPLDRVLIAVIVSGLALPPGECQLRDGQVRHPRRRIHLVATSDS